MYTEGSPRCELGSEHRHRVSEQNNRISVQSKRGSNKGSERSRIGIGVVYRAKEVAKEVAIRVAKGAV